MSRNVTYYSRELQENDRTHTMQVTLYIRHVTDESFRKYMLVVENSVAIVTADAELIQKSESDTDSVTFIYPQFIRALKLAI